MKKTLAAVAVLGAFAGSALAADVQLYGLVGSEMCIRDRVCVIRILMATLPPPVMMLLTNSK